MVISLLSQTRHHRFCIFHINLISFIAFGETDFAEVKANYTSGKAL